MLRRLVPITYTQIKVFLSHPTGGLHTEFTVLTTRKRGKWQNCCWIWTRALSHPCPVLLPYSHTGIYNNVLGSYGIILVVGLHHVQHFEIRAEIRITNYSSPPVFLSRFSQFQCDQEKWSTNEEVHTDPFTSRQKMRQTDRQTGVWIWKMKWIIFYICNNTGHHVQEENVKVKYHKTNTYTLISQHTHTSSSFSSSSLTVPTGSPSRGRDVVAYVFNVNQPSFLFRSCVYFCLYGPFNCISFHKFCRQLSAFSLRSSGLNSALLVLSTIYLCVKVSLSPDIIRCSLLGLKH